MDRSHRPALRVALIAALIVAFAAGADPVRSASRDEAGETASRFLSSFLDGDDNAAIRDARGDLDEWREILERHLPGDEAYSEYRVLDIKGSSRSRRAVVRVQRGPASEVFYLDFNGAGRIDGFYTIDEALEPLIDELRGITAEITSLELTPETLAELERLMAEQQRVASRIKNLLWRHRKTLESAGLTEQGDSG
jgi:hypothetical protein